jgi:hypothetical protein
MENTNCPQFTVDTSGVPSVATTQPPVLGVFEPPSNTSNYYFAPAEFVEIIGYGLYLPYSFSLADEDTLTAGTSVPGLILDYGGTKVSEQGQNSGSGLPIMQANAYHDTLIQAYLAESTIEDAMSGGIGVVSSNLFYAISFSISMIGVPSSLNGQTFYARPFIEVYHTNAMRPDLS